MVAAVKKAGARVARPNSTLKAGVISDDKASKAKVVLSSPAEPVIPRKSVRNASKRQPLLETQATEQTKEVKANKVDEQPHEVAQRRGNGRQKAAASVKRKPAEIKREVEAGNDSDSEENMPTETSCVTEDGLKKMTESFVVPMASSPIASAAKAVSKMDVTEETCTADLVGPAKTHRGIVAEMYAHERRQTRAANTSAGKAVNAVAAATGLLGTLPLQQAPPSTAATYYPYGTPAVGMPTAEPILSPYGISPYAEPGSSWTTNVYVNNLPPHTTDDDLLRLGSCFGRIKSHKAIINQETGLCKGYGFLMYEFLHDAELALQQLPLHGLSTSWAKESFSSKLRRMADSTTSNIYLSNLPVDITPTQLEQMFTPHEVISLRILTDPSTGKARGVGFVRLRDRAAAQDSIERLNGLIVPGQDSTLQVRFADSEAQKSFKMCARAQLNKAGGGVDDSRRSLDLGLLGNNSVTVNDTPQQIFLAALQGQHTWTGFPTPVVASGDFSPLLNGAISAPNPGHHPFAPSATTLQQQVDINNGAAFGLPMMFEAAQLNRQALEAVDAAALHRLQWLTNTQRPPTTVVQRPHAMGHRIVSSGTLASIISQQQQQQQHGGGGLPSLPSTAEAAKPTYLPPDLALQHARALMEKKAEQSSAPLRCYRPDIVASTEEHIEKERKDLLKMLEDAANAVAAKKPTADADFVKPRLGRSYSISAAKTVQQQERMVSNPLSGMRQSVSSNSISPLRFTCSKDPAAPIAVEAVDVIVTSEVTVSASVSEQEQNANGEESSYTSSAATATASAMADNDQDEPEEEEEEEEDSHGSSNISALSMRKSDSGKNFDCGAMDVFGDRHDVDVPIDAADKDVVRTNTAESNALHPGHTPPPKSKRDRSKSVLIHLPLVVAATTATIGL